MFHKCEPSPYWVTKPLSAEEKKQYKQVAKKNEHTKKQGQEVNKSEALSKKLRKAGTLEQQLPTNLGNSRRRSVNTDMGGSSYNAPLYPDTHIWMTTDTGLLKAVNLEKRIATNFYDGAQPSKEEGFVDICAANYNSCFGIDAVGKIKYFRNGKFTSLCHTGMIDTAFIDSLPSFEKFKSRYFDPQLRKDPYFCPSIKQCGLGVGGLKFGVFGKFEKR